MSENIIKIQLKDAASGGNILHPETETNVVKVSGFDPNGGGGNFLISSDDGVIIDSGKKLSEVPNSFRVGEVNTVSPGTGADVENVGQNGEIVLDFDIPQGVKGNDAVNPFKGWFDSASDLMGGTIVANKGDYAYVKAVDANQQPIVKIYEYNASGTNNWTDSGRTFDPRNDVSFNSGQQLDAVAIDDTHLSNAVSSEETNAPMVPKASDTQLLKQKLRGIELEETKVVVDIDNVSQTQNAYDGFFVKVITNGTKGIITTGAITPVSNAVLCVPVNGYDRVRFLGMVYSSEPTYYSSGYGFCTNEPTIVNNNDTDVDIVYSFDVDTTLSDNEKREYVVDIPEGMNYFVCTIRKYNNDVMSLEEFYTYKEKGQTIQIVDNTNTKNSDSGFSSNQGMLLNSKVGEMLTLNEENVELQDGVNVFDGAIRTQNVTDTNESTISWKGYISNGITTYGTYASKYIEIDVENVEYVRFIGLVFKYYSITGLDSYIKSNGYAFYRTNEKGGDTHVETDNFLKGYTWDYDSSIDEDYCIKEYVIEVPSEAKIMRITCEISTFPELGKYFYCYKKFGFNCSDFLNDYQKNNSVEEFIEIDSAFISSGRLMRSNHKMQYVTGSYYRYCLINVSEGEIYKIVNDDARRYAFLRTTTFPTETGTSMEIVNGTIYFTTNNGESIITIPKGCKALYIDATSQGTDYIGFDLYKLIYEPINKNEINSINDSIVNYALTDAFIREKYFTQLPGTETTWVSINRNDYPNNPGIISKSTGKWGNSNLGHIVIPLENVNNVEITSGNNYQTYYTFFSEYEYIDGNSYPTTKYATGYKTTKIVKAKKTEVIPVPSDAVYLYTLPDGNTYHPSSIRFGYSNNLYIYDNFSEYAITRREEYDNLLQSCSVNCYPSTFESVNETTEQEIGNSISLQNCLEKLHNMATFEWVPKLSNAIRKANKVDGQVAYFDTTQQIGIPYSGNMNTSIGFAQSLYTFKTAIDNQYSLMYTENLQDTISLWGDKVRHQPVNDHCRCWYGTFCNGLAAMSTNLPIPITCGGYDYWAKNFHLVTRVFPEYNPNFVRVGDIFTSGSQIHTMIVTKVVRNKSTKQITKICFTEASEHWNDSRVCEHTQMEWYTTTGVVTLENVDSLMRNCKNQGYHHYRVNEMFMNRYMDMFDFDKNNYQENTDICTFGGDKVAFAKGDLIVINYNLDNSINWNDTYTTLKLYRKNNGVYSVDKEELINQVSTSDIPSSLSNQIGHAWYLGTDLEAGSYKATVEGANSEKTTFFEVISDSVTLTQPENGKYVVTYTGNGELLGGKLLFETVNSGKSAVYLLLSNDDIANNRLEIYPESMCSQWSSYGGSSIFQIELFVKGEYGLVKTYPIDLIVQ